RTGVLTALAPLETVLLVPALQNRAMLALTAWNRALVVPLVLGVWNLVLDAPGALTYWSPGGLSDQEDASSVSGALQERPSGSGHRSESASSEAKLMREMLQQQQQFQLQMMQMLQQNQRSTRPEHDTEAELLRERRSGARKLLPTFEGKKDAQLVQEFLRKHHAFLKYYPADQRDGAPYLEHITPYLSGAANDWWLQLESSGTLPTTRDEFVSAFERRFKPANTHNTLKERLRGIKYEQSVGKYNEAYTKLLVEAEAAGAQFSQADLKNWYLGGLRNAGTGNSGSYLADMIPAALYHSGALWEACTLQQCQEAATFLFSSRGWSDGHKSGRKGGSGGPLRSVDASPAQGQRSQPYPKGSCYICKKKGHYAANCPQKDAQGSSTKGCNVDATKRDVSNSRKSSSSYLLSSALVEAFALPEPATFTPLGGRTVEKAAKVQNRAAIAAEVQNNDVVPANASIAQKKPLFATERPEPLIARRTFVVHGKLSGKFVRILVDTGCNTLM
ncbi:hypothetical protein HDV00_000362, partial [Rhizophlyctis rosea]